MQDKYYNFHFNFAYCIILIFKFIYLLNIKGQFPGLFYREYSLEATFYILLLTKTEQPTTDNLWRYVL